jgi:hypothetical protein
MKKKLWLGIVLIFSVCSPVTGNDSAASSALGGIQLRREPRVAMLKETLTINVEKVTVEYDFLNDTDHDISTEVAFPIPSYSVTFSASGIRDFEDFKVWVDDHEVKYQTFAKAKLGKADSTDLLKRQGVDIPSLGHFSDSGSRPVSADFEKLSQATQQSLIKAGLFGADDDHFPRWTVEKTYYWRQAFPARRILHVKHQYQSGIGFSPVQTTFLNQVSRKREIEALKKNKEAYSTGLIELAEVLNSACLSPELEKSLKATGDNTRNGDPGYVHMSWVDYILTTANSWKTPIKEFELNIEAQGPVSLCWDGRIDQIDATHRRATVKDFVPKKELRIVFFD